MGDWMHACRISNKCSIIAAASDRLPQSISGNIWQYLVMIVLARQFERRLYER